LKSNPDIFERSLKFPSEVRNIQRRLNELSELLCELTQQVDALREQLDRALDMVSNLWREVSPKCRC